MNLGKSLFILPNLFTLSSVFCGFYAMLATASAQSSGDFLAPALAIILAIFFDASDGRVARLTRTQSEFGIQLDSLADVVSFGVAPAFLIHQWALHELGLVGLVVSFLFVAAGACRLARFNVVAQRHKDGCAGDFVGLPIPLAAGLLAGLVVAHIRSGATSVDRLVALAGMVVILAFLMVSNIRYRSFKKVKPTLPGLALAAFLLFLTLGLGLVFRVSSVFVIMFVGYVFMGIAEELLRVGRAGVVRLRSASAGHTDADATDLVHEHDHEDDDLFV